MQSIWEKTVEMPKFEHLRQDVKTDVLVIGGGMAGILCAWKLKQDGVDCILVEAERIGSGITQNTTAKITSEHGAIFDTMLKRFGIEKTKKYLEANEVAIEQYRCLCNKIDCDFESKNAFVYSIDNRAKIEKEVAALEKVGFPVRFSENLPLPFPTVGAIEFRNQAQFHPLRFLSEIAKELKIFEKNKGAGIDWKHCCDGLRKNLCSKNHCSNSLSVSQ